MEKAQAMGVGRVEVDPIMNDKGRRRPLRLQDLPKAEAKVLLGVVLSLKVCIITEKVFIRGHFQVSAFWNKNVSNNIIKIILALNIHIYHLINNCTAINIININVL